MVSISFKRHRLAVRFEVPQSPTSKARLNQFQLHSAFRLLESHNLQRVMLLLAGHAFLQAGPAAPFQSMLDYFLGVPAVVAALPHLAIALPLDHRYYIPHYPSLLRVGRVGVIVVQVDS